MMKNLKAAAVVAGSLTIAGAAVPAAAADMSAQGLVGKGKPVAHSLPSAAKLPTGRVGNGVRSTADRVKQRVKESGVVKIPVFGGTLPNPFDGRLLGGLPPGR